MDPIEDRRILVLGSTYPSYSKTHDEVACTGGLLDGTTMIRVHPINFHQLDPESKFKKWNWIKARLAKSKHDPRPESYEIDPGSIRPDGAVTRPDEKRGFVEECAARFRSVASLQAARERDGTSLGIVVPQDVRRAFVRDRSPKDREAWDALEQQVLGQARLFDAAKPRKLEFPALEFVVEWDDADGARHSTPFHDWGIHVLARKYPDPAERREKVQAAMDRYLGSSRDLYFMLGTFRNHPANFGLMGMLTVAHGESSLFAAQPR